MKELTFVDKGTFNILKVMTHIRDIITNNEETSLVKDYGRKLFYNRKTREVESLYPMDSITFKYNNKNYYIKLNTIIWKEDYYQIGNKKINIEKYMTPILKVDKDNYDELRNIAYRIMEEIMGCNTDS